MRDNSNLITLVHKFYVLFKLNCLSLFFLLIGFFFFTFQAVFKASLVVIKKMKEENIDGYTDIKEIYMPVFKSEQKRFKNNSILSLSLMWLQAVLIIMKKINSPIAGSISLVIIYLMLMIILYCLYSQMLNVELDSLCEKRAKTIESLVYEFYKLSSLIYSILLTILVAMVLYYFPVSNLVIFPSGYILAFYKINLTNLNKFIALIKTKRINNFQ